MASEQDAARDRVVAARAELDQELDVLETSARAAVDIPAQIRKSPAKAAAIAGTAGFLILKGPQRLYRAARKAITGEPAPLPKRMLPKEIEKTLRSMGRDGDKVRGTLERDFADYAKKAEKDRRGLLAGVLLAVARPVLTRGLRALGESLMSPGSPGLGSRIAEARASAAERAATARASARSSAERTAEIARERVGRARAEGERPPGSGDDPEPTGI